MKTITLSERQIDALCSILEQYTQRASTLMNSKGNSTCFKTRGGKLFTTEESSELYKKLRGKGVK